MVHSEDWRASVRGGEHDRLRVKWLYTKEIHGISWHFKVNWIQFLD